MTLDKHQPSPVSPAYPRRGLAPTYGSAYTRAYTWSHATAGVHQGAAGSFGS